MSYSKSCFSRRKFLQGSAAAAATPLVAGLGASGQVAIASEGNELTTDFVRITADGRVIVVVKHLEAGQGPTTGLATLVAEEMNADWDKVETVFAPADNVRYANLNFGFHVTAGSTSVANSFFQYRTAGALVLARLKAAAAEAWGEKPESILASNSRLHIGDKSAHFGEFAARASQLPAPTTEPALKDPSDFIYIGRDDLPRNDIAGKINGQAKFALDVQPENALHVVVARSPKFGGRIKSFDDSESRKINGYAGAREIAIPGFEGNPERPIGVAVYAETLWGAIKARDALRTEWDFSAAETRSSKQMLADYRKALDADGVVAASVGDIDAELPKASKTVTADFSVPFAAHAPLETLNCTIQMRDGKVTLWDGCQLPGIVQQTVSFIMQVPPENVNIISMLAGGTFGRRSTPTSDYTSEAALSLRASPDPQRPIKLFWTREDDIKGGYYRPMFVHRPIAGLDDDGNITAWRHRIAGKSIRLGTPFAGAVTDNIDSQSVEGVADLSYSIPNFLADVRYMQESPITVLWLRSVGNTHTGFVVEVFMDMLAEAAGVDPVEFRLRHLPADHPRHIAALTEVAKATNWSAGPPPGRFRGIAVHHAHNSVAAQVAEISIASGNRIKVEKVTCAIHCGTAVNPDIIRAQVESCIGYGLGVAMRNQITLAEGGLVEQSNFTDYIPLRIGEMPHIETHIVKSNAPPTGVGEPAVPQIAPALSNAIYAATGKRITDLPFTEQGIEFAQLSDA